MLWHETGIYNRVARRTGGETTSGGKGKRWEYPSGNRVQTLFFDIVGQQVGREAGQAASASKAQYKTPPDGRPKREPDVSHWVPVESGGERV